MFNKNLDRSSSVSLNLGKSSYLNELFLNMVEDFQLINIWRERNPLVKDYTYYSNVHNSYAKTVVVFLVSPTLVKDITKVEIGNLVYADHAPIFFPIKKGKILFCMET